MEDLLDYRSDSSGAPSEGGEPAPKRARQQAAGPTAAAPPLLPPADALLDGSYSPPPAAAQRALEKAVLHQGRARAFPHVTGNFATHVYLEVPTPPSCLGVLDELLQLLQGQLPDVQPVVHTPSSSGSSSSSSSAAARRPIHQQHATAPAGHAALPAATLPTATLRAVIPAQSAAASNQIAHLAQPLYHVSLSRTVPLRLDQIQPLVEELRSRLRQQDAFQIQLSHLVVFCNDARTRTFLAVAAEAAGSSSSGSGSDELSSSSSGELEGSCGRDAEGAAANGTAAANGAAASAAARHPRRPNYSRQLVRMCHAVSGVFAAHGLPRFYADPQPHASIAWLLGDQQQQVEAALAAPAVRDMARRLANLSWQLRPAAVICKAGQRENVVWQQDGPASS